MFKADRYSASEFLSTPSVRRATTPFITVFLYLGISIHALREEGDLQLSQVYLSHLRFLSTPSVRRATITFIGHMHEGWNFYPRPP